MSLVGRWRIVEMELWAQEGVDMVGPGFIELGRDHTGSLGFIAVEGGVDWRKASHDGHPGVEEGHDDSDHASGRGWAVREDDGSLRGHICLHLGDDSSFRAEPADEARPKAKNARGVSRGRP